MLGIGAEQQADEIDHVLRGQALADGVEMRRVMGGERVVAEDGLGDRTVREHLRQLVLGARIDVEQRAARHADGGEAIFVGVADGAGDAHVDKHHLRRRKLDGMAVLPDADEARMRGDQHEIVAAVGEMALRARILRGGTFGNGQRDIVDHADLEPAIDAVAMARPDVEAAGPEGPVAPMFEGRTMRKARILVNEDARRLGCIHLISSPFPAP